jgi:hypothetical protein
VQRELENFSIPPVEAISSQMELASTMTNTNQGKMKLKRNKKDLTFDNMLKAEQKFLSEGGTKL